MAEVDPHIDIVIPWQPGNLGAAYNQTMEKADGWVCFLDHDILMLNPDWYFMIQRTVRQLGKTAGWITGMTNRIACAQQYCPEAPTGDNILDHMTFAKRQYLKYGDELREANYDDTNFGFSGFMILTHREAWEKTPGFMDGFLGVDNEYHKSVCKAGYKSYVLPGLYMYHIYKHKSLWGK
jgi:GT2 family glycosyltransferase